MPAIMSHLTTCGWLLLLLTLSCLFPPHDRTHVSASQLVFTASDDCTYATSNLNSPAWSTSAELLARAQFEFTDNAIQTMNLNTQAQACPVTSNDAAGTTIGDGLGLNSFDVTTGRLFQIVLSNPAVTGGGYQFSSDVKITNYATEPANVTHLTLPGTGEVQIMEYHPTMKKLLVVYRNGPSILLQALDIATLTTVSSATILLDLSSTLGQEWIMDGLSALDVAGNKLFVLTSVVNNGIEPTTTYSVVTIDLTTLSISSTYSFGSGLTSVEGMSWLPNLGECLLVSFDAAFRFNPTTQVLTQVTCVDSSLTAIRTAAGNTPLSSLQTAVYLSTHLWYAANSLTVDPTTAGSTLPYSALISTGLVSMIVQASSTIQPLLVLIDVANNACHLDALPRSAGGSVLSTTSLGHPDLISLQTYAPTPTIISYSPSTISGAGGMIMVNGTNFFRLPGLIGSTPICRFGTVATTTATLFNSTTLTCSVPPTSLSLLEFELVFMNETVTAAAIDINQCLLNNGGCQSPALCIHSYGSNSCSYSTCTNATAGSGCTCLQGYTSTSKTIAHCDACPVATYKPTASFDSCTKCPTYSSSATASYLSTDCICLSTFTRKDDGSCQMAGTGESTTVPVSVTFSIQSNWPTAIPSASDVSLQGQKSFKDGIIADLSLVLGISSSRLTVDSLAIDTTASSSLVASGSGGIYVLVSVSILPWSLETGTDTALDSTSQPYTPTQLAQFLELLSANLESALYSGTWTKTIRASTLTAQAEPEVVETVPWVKTTTGTAIIFFGAVLVLGLIVLGLDYASPSEARVLDLATVVLAMTNTVTNFTFILYLKNNLNIYDFSGAYYASLVFFFAPLTFNLCVTIKSMVRLITRPKSEPCGVVPMNDIEWKAHKNSIHYRKGDVKEVPNPIELTFQQWLMMNIPSTVIICVLSVLSIDCLALLTSQILWRKELSAPWKDGKALVNILGLIDVIFRDLPQLVIQVVVTQKTHTWSTLQEISVASSGMAVFFGLLVRGLTLVLRNLDKKRQAAESKQSPKQPPEAIELTPLAPVTVPAPVISESGLSLHIKPTEDANQAEVTINDVSSPTVVEASSPINETTPSSMSPVSPPGGGTSQLHFPTRNVILRVSNIMMISFCVITHMGMNSMTLVEGGLTRTSTGHILTAPLSVYGNVSVIDSQGVNQNLLALIQQQNQLLQEQSSVLQQQSQIIQQQSTSLAQQATALQVLNTTLQSQSTLIQQQSTTNQQQDQFIQQQSTTLQFLNTTLQSQTIIIQQQADLLLQVQQVNGAQNNTIKQQATILQQEIDSQTIQVQQLTQVDAYQNTTLLDHTNTIQQHTSINNYQNMTISALQAIAVSSINVVTFATAGVFVYTPPTNLIYCVVEVVGGGGGGGGSTLSTANNCVHGSGGGGGGYTKKTYLRASLSASIAIVVGGGGVGGTNGGASATAGGASSFGSSLISGGGSAGKSNLGTNQAAIGGDPGNASGGDINMIGSYGSVSICTTTVGHTGSGGNSFYGYGGTGITVGGSGSANSADPGRGWGGGGGGCGNSNGAESAGCAGGNGAGGGVLITEYLK